jgi:hypothetical protein
MHQLMQAKFDSYFVNNVRFVINKCIQMLTHPLVIIFPSTNDKNITASMWRNWCEILQVVLYQNLIEDPKYFHTTILQVTIATPPF